MTVPPPAPRPSAPDLLPPQQSPLDQRPNPSRAYDAGLSPIYPSAPSAPSPLSLESIDDLLAEEEPETTAGQGLFVRLLAGPTLFDVGVTSKDETAHSSIHGWGVGLGALVGSWVAENVVLAGELSASTARDPEIDGGAIAPAQGRFTFSTFSLGGDLIYLIQPLSISVSGGVLLSQMRLVDQATSYAHAGTRLGPALVTGMTKEWQVAPDWSVGATVRGSVAWPEDIRRSLDLTMIGVCFGLSVSYD
jgi:hypothetical protein